jgi:hypothetical protein
MQDEMYYSLHEAGSYYHEHGNLLVTVTHQPSLQTHLNDAIVDSLFSAHHVFNQIEYNDNSDMAKSLRPVLDDYRNTYEVYLGHIIDQNPHDDAWLETHTENTLKHCRTINKMISTFRPSSAVSTGYSQHLQPPSGPATTKKGKSVLLERLMTNFGMLSWYISRAILMNDHKADLCQDHPPLLTTGFPLLVAPWVLQPRTFLPLLPSHTRHELHGL